MIMIWWTLEQSIGNALDGFARPGLIMCDLELDLSVGTPVFL
jgi:hypothetical protein